ncbi:MAG: tetratricopeptide repeat protein [Verrucomicrobiae bacterium]|nr:tetratricopeptide repeat protein [Verrucomicrobiae bacterium]
MNHHTLARSGSTQEMPRRRGGTVGGARPALLARAIALCVVPVTMAQIPDNPSPMDPFRERLVATMKAQSFGEIFEAGAHPDGTLRVTLRAASGDHASPPPAESKRALIERLILVAEAALHAGLPCSRIVVSSETRHGDIAGVSAEPALIGEFFNRRISAREFFDRVEFSTRTWEPESSDPARRAQEFRQRADAILASKKSPETALRLLRRAVDEDPGPTPHIRALADALFQENEFVEAERHYAELVRREPATVESQERLVTCMLCNERYAPAIEAATKALGALESRRPEEKCGILYGMAYGMFQIGEHAAAEGILRKYLEIRREPPANVCWLMAGALMGQNKMKEAAEWAQDAVRLEPDDPINYRTLGAALSQRDGHREAIAAYRRYIELLSKEGRQAEAWVFVSLSYCHVKLGETKAANEAAAQGLLIYPDESDLRTNYKATYAALLKAK